MRFDLESAVKNVVVGDDDDAVFVPDFGVLAEFAFEHANGPRPADVVRHEDVGVDPNVIAGLDFWFTRGAGEDFFCECHFKIGAFVSTLSFLSDLFSYQL